MAKIGSGKYGTRRVGDGKWWSMMLAMRVAVLYGAEEEEGDGQEEDGGRVVKDLGCGACGWSCRGEWISAVVGHFKWSERGEERRWKTEMPVLGVRRGLVGCFGDDGCSLDRWVWLRVQCIVYQMSIVMVLRQGGERGWITKQDDCSGLALLMARVLERPHHPFLFVHDV